MGGTIAISFFDSPCLSSLSYLLSSLRERHWQYGGDRCRAHTKETGHRLPVARGRVEYRARAAVVQTRVVVRRGPGRAAGNSQSGYRTGMLGRRRRIHSASTIAAASLIAAHAGSTTLVTPINTTSTSRVQR
ncbi:hypothetical protein [Mycobacterium sp. 1465703.0]|uniref:hypothetical protein n=1 Tax=Mycobacterium sp. 1465703.0 TaxID=1834078 RepID=UPI0012EAF657|nr:hypothetical protein [Mycobacterium sp. 1465703.0]